MRIQKKYELHSKKVVPVMGALVFRLTSLLSGCTLKNKIRVSIPKKSFNALLMYSSDGQHLAHK